MSQDKLHIIAGRTYAVNHTFYGNIIIAVIGYADQFKAQYCNGKHQVLKVKLKNDIQYQGSGLLAGTELYMNKGFINSFKMCN